MYPKVSNLNDLSYIECQGYIEALCERENEKQQLVYLSSPLYKGEGNWQELFQSNHKIKYINPKRWYTDDPGRLVFMDKLAILNCDYMIAYIPKLSAGASMEILYASLHNKTVLTVVRKDLLSPWHSSHCRQLYTYEKKFLHTSLKCATPLLRQAQQLIEREAEAKYSIKDERLNNGKPRIKNQSFICTRR